MQRNIKKINSLTSLRFFAAFMIIALHTNGVFIYLPIAERFSLQLGVSVFFVLSGFILTYVYPELKAKDVWPFIRARIARIWPAHFAALLLACLVMHEYVQLKLNQFYFILSATMVNCWIPIEGYYMKFNQPAWSISTEFFFYLCFPLLIYRLTTNWYSKLAATLLIALVIIYLCDRLNLPTTNEFSISKLSLVYYNPWCRLFEFVTGMCTALLFNKISHINFHFLPVSVLEITFITLMLLSFAHYYGWYIELYKPLSPATNIWMTLSGGSSLFIAMVILVLALQKGIVNKILCLPLLVSLGEISYSLYLVHNTFLAYYGVHAAEFSETSMLLRSCFFWTITFTCAYLMWRFVEVPGRYFITNFSLSQIWKTKSRIQPATIS